MKTDGRVEIFSYTRNDWITGTIFSSTIENFEENWFKDPAILDYLLACIQYRDCEESVETASENHPIKVIFEKNGKEAVLESTLEEVDKLTKTFDWKSILKDSGDYDNGMEYRDEFEASGLI